MAITVNTSPQQITASVGETKIDVTVSGGIGPSGPVGGGYLLPTATASVLGGVKIGSGVTITDGVISVSTNYAAASHTHAISDITNLATTLSGIDSAIGERALAADFDQPLKTTDGVTFTSVTVDLNGAGFGRFRYTNGSDGSVLRTFSGGDFEPLPIGTAGQALVVNAGATDIEWATLSYAAVSHAHGSITSDGKVGTTAGLVLKTGTAGVVEALAQGTAGQVLKVNSGATGVEWGAAAADVSIDASAADVLSASSGSITADDPGADRLVFWDDSAGKLTHLTVSTGLSISGTTMTASVSASDISAGTLAYARMADPAVTSPSQITANQNDYASFARGINRFTTNAARDITGMVAGSDGEVRVLCNVGTTAANTLTIKDESTSSTAGNRFSVPWNGDCVIPAEGSVVVFYDGTSSRWRVMA